MKDIINHLYYLVIISMVVSVIALTVTKTKVFKPLRVLIKTKSEFFGELFSCPFCFSFYPSFGLTLLYFSYLRFTNVIVQFDFIIVWFSIVCISSFLTGFIYRSISQIE